MVSKIQVVVDAFVGKAYTHKEKQVHMAPDMTAEAMA
jgi:hypothetical protein